MYRLIAQLRTLFRSHSHQWAPLDSVTPAPDDTTEYGVRVHRMGGNIDIAEAPSGASLTTMGGSIRLGVVHEAASLTTYAGNIDVSAATGSVNATTMSGDVTLHLRSAADQTAVRNIWVSSNAGSIVLYLPADFGAEVHVTLAYTQNSPGVFRIDAAGLGLQEESTSKWERPFFSTPRKYIHAAGRLGDGRNRVDVRTVNGNITLRRAACN